MTEKPFTGTTSKRYVASPEVAEIVNLAVELQRPLLVEGEAGCGKTRLAYAVAEEKGLGEPVKVSVKSTSQARDLLWRFDGLRRLQDAQRPGNTSAQHIYPYLSLGQLGQAISSGRPSVVLIDEIDKADIDFPNDLLDVLDTFEFEVSDLPPDEESACRKENGFGRTVKAQGSVRPIVIITSNREKRLPEAFLRRCLYVRVRFPRAEEELSEIVRKNTGLKETDLGAAIMTAAVRRFTALRDDAIEVDAQKPPSTSELIDWVRILHWKGASVEQLQEEAALPPYWRTLFKTYPDLEIFEVKEKGLQESEGA